MRVQYRDQEFEITDPQGLRDYCQSILAAGCDFTHVHPDRHDEICDCDGLSETACSYGRQAARAMADVARAMEAGEFEAAYSLESDYGDTPSVDEALRRFAREVDGE